MNTFDLLILTGSLVATTACGPSRGRIVSPLPAWTGLPAGRFAVRIDTLMRWAPEKRGWAPAGRPVQITIWSPAREMGSALTFQQYVELTSNQASLAPPNLETSARAVAGLRQFVVAQGSAGTAVDAWFHLPVAASWDARVADGRFPLVIIAQGNYHSAYHQAVLAQFFASNGFVVATSASPLVLGQDTLNPADLLALARRQAADIEYIYHEVAPREHVDAQRLALVAHSFGARAGFIAIADGLPARSFVSLDGGIANRSGKDWLRGTALDTATVSTTLLHFYQTDDDTVIPDFDMVRTQWVGDRTLVKVAHMYHPYFTSLGFVAAVDSALHFAPATEALRPKVNAIADETLAFLVATLNGTKASPMPRASFLSIQHFSAGVGAGIDH